MQESRLFKIVYHLLDKGQATAPELAEKFEVSVRTIYRDIDALSGAGIPVYAETGRNGGIHLMNDFVLDKAVLSEEEKQEILTALQSVNSTNNIGSNQTLQKLSAIFHISSEDWLEVDFSRWGNKGTDNEKFEWLKSAIIYQNTIVLRFPKNMSYRVYDEFDKTMVSKKENGDLIVSAQMPEDEWLIGYLLSFGTQVDIIEPAYLKDIVAEQAQKIYEKYTL